MDHEPLARERALAGAAILLACGQYFVAERVASSAWRDPPYRYGTNYISDLGVVGCTPRLCSPLAAVMNGGFLVAGVLCILGALLLAPLIRHRILRRAILAFAALHGLGSMIVGLVHSAPGTVDGTPPVHLLGAYLAVVAGNFALVLLGFGAPASRLFRIFSVALGGIGIGSGLALVLSRTAFPGLIERLAVDTIPVWEVATGAVLLILWIGKREPRQANT